MKTTMTYNCKCCITFANVQRRYKLHTFLPIVGIVIVLQMFNQLNMTTIQPIVRVANVLGT